ncbi:SDR family NAD(P)-dependent oxidoreductase [Actinomadura sp. KC216]|uniref:SDR family NAD(P)-dependent oxidoreductase n=1 Tax=Actinomadura sp. KC216 TaxID=2530370 RepID=UPI001045E0F6|nr:SDR family NAD(P)-dependent oxidoreductase [Actinomadura sp. KC216]TDB79845.1 SDR family NAD(P)-dependent oxidoreductase [Actinomadura sp. KC216]
MDLRGADVLLAGASGGIGRAVAVALAGRGARLVLTGRRVDVLEPLAEQLGGGARVIAADLADRSAGERLLAEADPVDVLVANAALPASGLLADEIDRALDVNLRAPSMMAKLASAQMAESGRGHLVFVSSLSEKTASGNASLYNATKFGMRGFALALREDLRPHGVGVSTIFPGFIRDAGMFAETGVTLPRGVGTRSPEDVPRATVRTIERNVAEIDVAPLGLRLGARFSGLAPVLSSAVQRRAGGARVSRGLADGQRRKR